MSIWRLTIWGHSVPFIENLQDDRLITLSLSHHKRGPFLILFYWNTRIAFWFFSNAQGVKVPSGWFKFQEDWKKWMQSHHQLFTLATSFLPSPWYFCGCPKSSTAALRRRHMCEGHTASREFSSTTGFDFCYFSVIPAEPRVPRIPLALFRDTPDDSMENQETWALSSTPIPNEILSQIISILIETWKRGSDRYEAQRELPARSLPSNTALSPPCRRAAVHRQRRRVEEGLQKPHHRGQCGKVIIFILIFSEYKWNTSKECNWQWLESCVPLCLPGYCKITHQLQKHTLAQLRYNTSLKPSRGLVLKAAKGSCRLLQGSFTFCLEMYWVSF